MGNHVHAPTCPHYSGNLPSLPGLGYIRGTSPPSRRSAFQVSEIFRTRTFSLPASEVGINGSSGIRQSRPTGPPSPHREVPTASLYAETLVGNSAPSNDDFSRFADGDALRNTWSDYHQSRFTAPSTAHRGVPAATSLDDMLRLDNEEPPDDDIPYDTLALVNGSSGRRRSRHTATSPTYEGFPAEMFMLNNDERDDIPLFRDDDALIRGGSTKLQPKLS